MKKKLLMISLFFIVLLGIVFTSILIVENNRYSNTNKGNQIVNINEIEQLYKNGNSILAEEKLEDLATYLRQTTDSFNPTPLIIMLIVSIIFVLIIFTYIYIKMIRPFDKLKGFASNIAKGNFDIPLEYERTNFFGDFTWAFDSMRKEVIKSRKCEKEAIENNKTVIASLSHDIKTPIASIKAYSEALEANMDSTYEARVEYVSVISRKADEVKKLTDDLFLHSLSNMDRISVNSEKIDLVELLNNSIKDFKANQTINLDNSLTNAFIMGDKERVYQIFENIINNSIKYANTKIDVKLLEDNEYYIINFKDYGPGINDSDLPFIFEKFYRGVNSKDKQGTGLGLYIVKYMLEKMDGKVELENNNGLLVKIYLKKLIS